MEELSISPSTRMLIDFVSQTNHFHLQPSLSSSLQLSAVKENLSQFTFLRHNPSFSRISNELIPEILPRLRHDFFTHGDIIHPECSSQQVSVILVSGRAALFAKKTKEEIAQELYWVKRMEGVKLQQQQPSKESHKVRQIKEVLDYYINNDSLDLLKINYRNHREYFLQPSGVSQYKLIRSFTQTDIIQRESSLTTPQQIFAETDCHIFFIDSSFFDRTITNLIKKYSYLDTMIANLTGEKEEKNSSEIDYSDFSPLQYLSKGMTIHQKDPEHSEITFIEEGVLEIFQGSYKLTTFKQGEYFYFSMFNQKELGMKETLALVSSEKASLIQIEASILQIKFPSIAYQIKRLEFERKKLLLGDSNNKAKPLREISQEDKSRDDSLSQGKKLMNNSNELRDQNEVDRQNNNISGVNTSTFSSTKRSRFAIIHPRQLANFSKLQGKCGSNLSSPASRAKTDIDDEEIRKASFNELASQPSQHSPSTFLVAAQNNRTPKQTLEKALVNRMIVGSEERAKLLAIASDKHIKLLQPQSNTQLNCFNESFDTAHNQQQQQQYPQSHTRNNTINGTFSTHQRILSNEHLPDLSKASTFSRPMILNNSFNKNTPPRTNWSDGQALTMTTSIVQAHRKVNREFQNESSNPLLDSPEAMRKQTTTNLSCFQQNRLKNISSNGHRQISSLVCLNTLLDSQQLSDGTMNNKRVNEVVPKNQRAQILINEKLIGRQKETLLSNSLPVTAAFPPKPLTTSFTHLRSSTQIDIVLNKRISNDKAAELVNDIRRRLSSVR